jgi:hypothetical protein
VTRRRWYLCVAALLAAPLPAPAQTPPARYIEAARAQIEALNADSAASLLRYAVDPRTGAGVADRLRGYVLLGIAELTREDRPEARAALQQALALDPELRVDSLAFLHSDLLSTFNAERASIVRARGLSLVVEMPADTLVPVQGGGYQVVVLPTRRARVVLAVATELSAAPLYSDSLVTSGVTTFGWSLRLADGRLVAPGRYRFRISAQDSAGDSTAVERALTIERERVDTQLLPPTLPPSAFAAESVRVRQLARAPLLRGLAFGAAAGVLALLGTGPSGVKDSRAFVIGGTVALAGVAGLVSSGSFMRANPEGIERNRRLREQDDSTRQAITVANAQARDRARLRIRTSSVTP